MLNQIPNPDEEMGLLQLLTGLEGAAGGGGSWMGHGGMDCSNRSFSSSSRKSVLMRVWWMDSHVHLPQQGSCGDPIPVDHKLL